MNAPTLIGPMTGALLCLMLAASWPSPASAAAGSPAQRARQLIDDAEFDEALTTINAALAAPGISEAQRAILYQLQGTTHLYLGREDQARESFSRLLETSPDYQLPAGISPKIRSLFETVRSEARARPKREVSIEHVPPVGAKAGAPIEFAATIADLPRDARARLYYRRAGRDRFNSVFFGSEDGRQHTARVPALDPPAETGSFALEYYVEVADSTGRRLAGVGTPGTPASLQVSAALPAAQEPPTISETAWYQKWWVWAIVGGVAAGATAAVLIPLADDEPATLPVTVRIQQ